MDLPLDDDSTIAVVEAEKGRCMAMMAMMMMMMMAMMMMMMLPISAIVIVC